jgi:hypothetical protein
MSARQRTIEAMSRAQMRRELQEAGWSRHQSGFAWRKPKGDPDRAFYSLEDAYRIVTSLDAGGTEAGSSDA